MEETEHPWSMCNDVDEHVARSVADDDNDDEANFHVATTMIHEFSPLSNDK